MKTVLCSDGDVNVGFNDVIECYLKDMNFQLCIVRIILRSVGDYKNTINSALENLGARATLYYRQQKGIQMSKRYIFYRPTVLDRLKPAASHAILNGSGQGGFLSWL